MTIAGLYLSPEGVVLGADSTSSVVTGDGSLHFFDFTQKVFEIGEGSTLGLITWGLGGLGDLSYRTVVALLADDLAANPPTSVSDVANRWAARFWNVYVSSQIVQRFLILDAMPAFDPAAPAGKRSEAEEREHGNLAASVGVGFCIAGYVLPSRTPEAATLKFFPNAGQPAPQLAPQHTLSWFGVPNFFQRLLFGVDQAVLDGITNSGKWTGSNQELVDLASAHSMLPAGVLPIRDAIDYVNTCIHSTIKAMKFSPLPQVCGGPIELAVITTDRQFRWVRHKTWDSAITDGEM